MDKSGRLAGRHIIGNLAPLATRIVETEYARNPEWLTKYGDAGRVRCREDAEFHLSHLAESMVAENRRLFFDYLAWAKLLLQSRGIPVEHLVRHLKIAGEILERELPEPFREPVDSHLRAGLETIPALPGESASMIGDDNVMADMARQYLDLLLRGNRQDACTLVLDSVDRGVPVRDLYRHIFEPCLREIGRLWQIDQISVAQEHFFSAATQLIMSQLYPHIFGGERSHGVIVMTCVSGELHEIGGRMVADTFEMEGWSAHYLGANTPHDAVVGTLAERSAVLLGVSATMTFHLSAVERLIQAVRASDKVGNIPVLVGGRAFEHGPDLWKTVGANGWAPSAHEASEAGARLVR